MFKGNLPCKDEQFKSAKDSADVFNREHRTYGESYENCFSMVS